MTDDNLMLDQRTGELGITAEWVDVFAHVWELPAARLERLLGLLSDDVVLRAPTTPPISKGKDEARRAFSRAFAGMPDLKGRVHNWARAENVLFVEMEFMATVGGHAISWANVDRFLIKNSVVTERVAHFDSAKVKRAFTRNLKGILQYRRMRRG